MDPLGNTVTNYVHLAGWQRVCGTIHVVLIMLNNHLVIKGGLCTVHIFRHFRPYTQFAKIKRE
ncbi:hypothetical protein PSV09DRAFT_2393089 [Bipolaris maydis]|nr:hypothetical protein PSV09DRAFT_2393089 [Bipolaris maydis]